MATNGANNVEDTEMADCDGEKVVTMMDVLQEEQDFEDDANAVLGASDEKNCTFSRGYIKRQAIYACLTCCTEAKDDPTKRAGVCLACSLNCHENHELIELYTKRNFRCDCGNPKFNSHPCQFTPDKSELNLDNNYNQNFSGLYCNCHRPYPDPESTVEDEEMIQCIICEDWLHSSHLDAVVPGIDQYSEMICKACMDANEFLHDYSNLAVNVETDVHITAINVEKDIDVTDLNAQTGDLEASSINGTDVKESKDELETEKLVESTEVSAESTSEQPINEMHIDEEVDENKPTPECDDATVSGDATLKGETTGDLVSEKPLLETKDDSNEVAAEAGKEENPAQAPESSDVKTDSKDDENTEVISEESTKPTEDSEESPKPTENSEESKKMAEETSENPNEVKESAEDESKDTPQNENEEESKDTVPQNKNEEESKDTLPQNENEPPNTIEAHQDKNDTKEAQECAKSEIPEESEQTEVNKPICMTTETSEEESTKTELQSVEQQANTKESDVNETDQNMTENDQTIAENETKTSSTDTTTEPNTTSGDIQMDDTKPAQDEDSNAANEDTSSTKITETEKPLIEAEINDSVSKLDSNEIPQNGDINGDEPSLNSIEVSSDTVDIEDSKDKKRKLSTEEVTDDSLCKKPKLTDETCSRPKSVKRAHKGATFWSSNFRQKLCTCSECLSMYKDLSVLFLIDPEDTMMAYETLGKEMVDGRASQYEKGLEALSSLDRIQQINALTEYNKMKDKLLDFLKSFKDRKEIVKEEDIKAFFAGMKPKREPDGVYFCR